MTDDEAISLRDAIIAKLAGCPPAAIARLVTSIPEENIVIQTRAQVRTQDGGLCDITVSISQTACAPTPEGPSIPAEIYSGPQAAKDN